MAESTNTSPIQQLSTEDLTPVFDNISQAAWLMTGVFDNKDFKIQIKKHNNGTYAAFNEYPNILTCQQNKKDGKNKGFSYKVKIYIADNEDRKRFKLNMIKFTVIPEKEDLPPQVMYRVEVSDLDDNEHECTLRFFGSTYYAKSKFQLRITPADEETIELFTSTAFVLKSRNDEDKENKQGKKQPRKPQTVDAAMATANSSAAAPPAKRHQPIQPYPVPYQFQFPFPYEFPIIVPMYNPLPPQQLQVFANNDFYQQVPALPGSNLNSGVPSDIRSNSHENYCAAHHDDNIDSLFDEILNSI